MNLYSCCFSGHRNIPKELQAELKMRVKNGIDYLYARGVKTFYAGGALGFDSLAAEAVISRRDEHGDIRLIIVIPCRDQTAKWSDADKTRYERINSKADEIICLAEHYFQGCMQQRNRFMVDHSQICICYLKEQAGGTAYTVRYAQEHGLQIYNLAKPKGGATN